MKHKNQKNSAGGKNRAPEKTLNSTKPKASAKGISAKSRTSSKQKASARQRTSASPKAFNKKMPSPKTPRGLKQSGETVTGVIEGNPKGYGFLVVEGRSEDAFVAANKMHGARHGDTVEAAIISNHKGGGEAAVLRVIKRRFEKIVGTFFAEKDYGYCVPDELRFAKEIFIPAGETGNAKHLDKVVVELTESDSRDICGRVAETLGAAEDKGVDILSIIRSYNLYENFPPIVLKEADRVAIPVPAEEAAQRRDFRGELIFTIDGDDSRDFDDAVSLVEKENGNFVLGVHIADVAHYVRFHSALDKEALKRGTSVYFCDRVLPMLPPKLSNDICSLNEGADRLTLSVIMEIDRAGKVIKHEICEGVIKSRARMTYSAVAKILDGDPELCGQYGFLVPALQTMERLAKILYKKRKNRGNIDFDLPEAEIILNEQGRAVDVKRKPRLVSHRIIEEFMLAANETVAERFAVIRAPFVYRVHEDPPAEKVGALIDFLKGVGVAFSGNEEKPSPGDFSALLQSVSGGAFETAVSRATLRTMSKACYMPVNKGHFGLAAEFYCHFTSPIRRYPDLAIHRIIKDFLHKGEACFKQYPAFVSEASTESSERERLAEKAERDVDDLKKAEYMEDKIGNRYGGVISGVTEWGIFVELPNTVEGMVRIENLPGDGYEHDPRHMRISSGVRSFRIGDPLEIEVAAVNGAKIEFRLAPV